ncbi:MAG TPA: DUF6295 family protein [Acidimicrobiales bacterium]|nr:DUF6295 family protein [Acidimicrobiales bacterium]
MATCAYRSVTLTLQGGGEGTQGWFAVTDATVYFDHPVHALEIAPHELLEAATPPG